MIDRTTIHDFHDISWICTTGGQSVPLDLDSFRPSYPCDENFIDWDDVVPVIGLIDAPEFIPAGCCISNNSWLEDRPVQAIIRRK